MIPAHLASTRLPRKVLLPISGKPMLQHVYERVARAQCRPDVFVATGDDDIAEAVSDFGGQVLRTCHEHASGTDRIAEAVDGLDYGLIVNVQADEPLVRPSEIDSLAEVFADSTIQMATLSRPVASPAEIEDPNRVKVVVDGVGDALYFSRAPIPHDAARREPAIASRIHLGLYAYRLEFLQRFASSPRGRLEKLESLEQLRALEQGWKIRVIETDWSALSVDTAEDLERVRNLMSDGSGTFDVG